MRVWYVDVTWALMLLGVALWTGCCLVFNPVLRSIRIGGLVVAYGVLAWMLISLPLAVAVATWCLFAAFGGALSFAYELWARFHYRTRGRQPRPLVLLRGFLLWPSMIPDALEGVLVDAGVLDADGRHERAA
ncbi:MAG: hypothetical protein KF709_03355 [Gemmatimonadaceae bacterium]|nr:hypothetical protein [Gemmatimonadaceae bacterium]